ncbi:MAG: zinc-ribbon domain-containing protein, partial [Chloroflexi bacterium]
MAASLPCRTSTLGDLRCSPPSRPCGCASDRLIPKPRPRPRGVWHRLHRRARTRHVEAVPACAEGSAGPYAARSNERRKPLARPRAVLTCSVCGTANEDGRKFCVECGTKLAAGCPVCGTVNPAGAKFCGECGTPLAAAGEGAAAGTVSAELPDLAGNGIPALGLGPVSERRLVSVLFADLVGFTAASEARDAEDTREFLSRYFEVASQIVDRHGGIIEKFIGDAVMAVWGTPTAHEDDAERAVRTALEMVAAVAGLGPEGERLQVRAGVLTGEAAVTIGATGQGMVAGDLVNTASRLQSVAAPGNVLVGEATYRAAAGAIAFEDAGPQELKGKEAPVPAWRATAVVARRGGQGRAAVLEPPFVGRDEELRALKEQYHATAREGKPRLVTIAGQAGIGKSRLAWELEKYLDGVVEQIYWHEGRSPSYGEGISYWALAEMVRGRAGIAETDDPETARRRLGEILEQVVPDAGERKWVEPRLSGLLGLEELPAENREELLRAARGAGRGAARLLGPSMGGSGAARLHRARLELVAELAHLRPRGGAAGALRPSARLGNRRAQCEP